MRVIRTTAQIVLIFLVSTAVILPIFGWSVMDFGQPTKVGWVTKTDDKGQVTKEADYDYPKGIRESVQRTYDMIHLPIRPDYTLVFGLCFLVGVVYVLVVYSNVQNVKDFEELAPEILPKAVVAQSLVTVLSVVSFAFSNDPEEKLKQSVLDPELVKVLVENYNITAHVFSWLFPLFFLAVFDVFVLILSVVLIVFFESAVEYLKRRARQESSVREINGRVVIIREDGTTEYSRLNWELKWVPWPVMFLNRERLSVTSFRAFLLQLANEAKKFVTERMLANLENVAQQSFSGMDEKIIGGFVQAWNGQFLEWTRINQNKIKADLGSDSFSTAENLLGQASADTVRIIKQELSAEASDITRRHLNNLWENVLGGLENISQSGAGLGEITPILPEGAKLLIRRGDTTVVVVEQKPQIRTIEFNGQFINRFGGFGVVENRKKERFRLAFPYTIFIIRFIKDKLGGICFFYRNSSLVSIHDYLFNPNLPNVGEVGVVCMGGDFSRSNKEADMAGQVEQVIGYFWDSEFNTDLHDGFVSMAERESGLKNLKEWEKRTSENPAFVLKAYWSRLCTLDDLLKRLLENSRPIDLVGGLKHLTREKSGQVSAQIGSEILERITALDFSQVSNKVALETILGEMHKLGSTMINYILSHADKCLAGEGQRAEERLVGCFTETASQVLADQMAGVVNQDEFVHSVDIWDTMQKLIPREEEARNGSADSDLHPDAGE